MIYVFELSDEQDQKIEVIRQQAEKSLGKKYNGGDVVKHIVLSYLNNHVFYIEDQEHDGSASL